MRQFNCPQCKVKIWNLAHALPCSTCEQRPTRDEETFQESLESEESRRPTDRYYRDRRRAPRRLPQIPLTPAVRGVGSLEGSGEILAWLVCAPLPPLPLTQNGMVTIGRSMSNTVVLPHKKVSRRHAMVQVTRNAVYVNDFSANGTQINGRPVVFQRFKPGDVLTVGPYTLRCTTAAMETAASPSETLRPAC